MSSENNKPTDGIDDAYVYPASKNSEFIKVFSNLFTQLPAAKWKEIKSKSKTKDELQILVETAIELSSSGSGAALFRKKGDADETLIGIWYARVLRHAKRMISLDGNKVNRAISPQDLRDLVQLSLDPENLNRLPDILLRDFGVILVIERGFAGMKLDGIATTLPSGQILIGLSLRYPRYDHFWFTLMHELSHACMHEELLRDSVIYDDLDETSILDVEIEANRMAADSIIPRYIFNKSAALRDQDELHIYNLAKQASIHPILAAGAIQHHKRDYKIYSKLTNSLNVREILGVDQ